MLCMLISFDLGHHKTDFALVSTGAWYDTADFSSTENEYPVGQEQVTETLSDNLLFAAAVAETGMILRNNVWIGTATWDSALELVRKCGNVTGDVYKEEFLYLLTLLQREN